MTNFHDSSIRGNLLNSDVCDNKQSSNSVCHRRMDATGAVAMAMALVATDRSMVHHMVVSPCMQPLPGAPSGWVGQDELVALEGASACRSSPELRVAFSLVTSSMDPAEDGTVEEDMMVEDSMVEDSTAEDLTAVVVGFKSVSDLTFL